jgi:glycosyltransferase involved in cell wall biosynthesis
MTSTGTRSALRVVHVVNLTRVGGVETYLAGLLAELTRRGHRNVVLADGAELPESRTDATIVHQLGGLELPGAEKGRSLIGLAKAAIAASPADVALIHGWMNPALASFIVRTLPSVFFVHNYGVFCPSGSLLYQRTDTVCQLSGVPNWRCLANAYLQQCNTRRPGPLLASYQRARSQKRLLGLVDGIVVLSDYVKRRLMDNGVPQDAVSILPSPAPRDTFQDELESREPIVLFVGRITPHKGLSYLLRAMATVRQPARLIVAGDGYDMAKMRRLTAALGIADRTEYVGIVGREEVDTLYRRASVLVVPSVWPEPWGLIGPEAMASGLPVVAFRSGGIPEWLVDGGTGFLVEPRDVNGLASRIDQLIGDPELVRRLGSAGRAAAQARFTVEVHADALVDVFWQVIDRRGRGGVPRAVAR